MYVPLAPDPPSACSLGGFFGGGCALVREFFFPRVLSFSAPPARSDTTVRAAVAVQDFSSIFFFTFFYFFCFLFLLF